MTICALLELAGARSLLGAVIAVMWKIRGLTLAWGVVSGGVGRSGGRTARSTILPAGTLFDATGHGRRRRGCGGGAVHRPGQHPRVSSSGTT